MSLPTEVELLLLDVVGRCMGLRGSCGMHPAGIAQPGAPTAPRRPTASYPAPLSLRVPRHEQRPTTIRLPAANLAGVRAPRLTSLWLPGATDSLEWATDQQREQVMPG
ncbi:MAG: hypothetical protein ACT4NY_07880 [Pseudonocardiales bacterium]